MSSVTRMPRRKAFPLFGQKGQDAEGSFAAACLGIRNKMCITVAFAECYLNGLSTAESILLQFVLCCRLPCRRHFFEPLLIPL